MKKFILIVTLFLASCSLYAQWTSDTDLNTPVAAVQTGDLQSVGTSDGKTYVAYWHDVPAPQYYEMRLQLLDENGIQLFGPAGMVVDNTVAMSSFTVTWSVTVDKNNNIYIGFTGTGSGNPAIIHKIAPDGTQLWGPSGISPGAGYDVKVLPLNTGEAIISWLPGNNGLLQKVAADGTAVWANPVTLVPAVAGHKTSGGELAELSGGDVVVIIHDRSGFSPSSLPYAQRYDTNGAAVWSSPVALSNTFYTVFNRRYPFIKDGDVLYFGYSGAQGIQPHGFVQRINPDGSLPWGINGTDFSTQTTYFERDVKIAFSPGAANIWAICEYSDAAQGAVGEYVQKLDKVTGAQLLTGQGKAIFPVSAAYISHQGELRVADNQPVFLVSDGNSNGVFPKDLLVVYLDTNGDFAWPEHTRPVATNATGVKSRIQLNTPFNGKITAAWAENRSSIGEPRPFAQQLQLSCTNPTAGFAFMTNELETTFTSFATNADSIAWDFGDNTTGTGANPTHTFPAAGIYKVCQTVTNACGTAFFCKTVMVTCALPQVSFVYNAAFTTVYFQSTVTGENTVLWNFGDGNFSSELNPVHMYQDQEPREVCLYAYNACGVDSSCQEVYTFIGNAHYLETTYQLAISPNPNHGTCSLHLDLPQSAPLTYALLSSAGEVIKEQSMTLESGPHDIAIAADLPSGTYFVKVEMDGHIGGMVVVVH